MNPTDLAKFSWTVILKNKYTNRLTFKQHTSELLSLPKHPPIIKIHNTEAY